MKTFDDQDSRSKPEFESASPRNLMRGAAYLLLSALTLYFIISDKKPSSLPSRSETPVQMPHQVTQIYENAFTLYKNGDYEGAVAKAKEALASHPTHGPAKDLLRHAEAALTKQNSGPETSTQVSPQDTTESSGDKPHPDQLTLRDLESTVREHGEPNRSARGIQHQDGSLMLLGINPHSIWALLGFKNRDSLCELEGSTALQFAENLTLQRIKDDFATGKPLKFCRIRDGRKEILEYRLKSH